MFRRLCLGHTLSRMPFLAISAGSVAALVGLASIGADPSPKASGAAWEWPSLALAALAAHVLVVALIRRSRDARTSPLFWATPLAGLAAFCFRWPGSAAYGVNPLPVLAGLGLAMVLLIGLLPSRGAALPAEKTLVL